MPFSPGDFVDPDRLDAFQAAMLQTPENGVFYRAKHVLPGGVKRFGNLTLSVDSAGLILDTPDVTPKPVQGFVGIVADTTAAGGATIVPVPEPTSGLLTLVPLVALAWRKRYFGN